MILNVRHSCNGNFHSKDDIKHTKFNRISSSLGHSTLYECRRLCKFVRKIKGRRKTTKRTCTEKIKPAPDQVAHEISQLNNTNLWCFIVMKRILTYLKLWDEWFYEKKPYFFYLHTHTQIVNTTLWHLAMLVYCQVFKAFGHFAPPKQLLEFENDEMTECDIFWGKTELEGWSDVSSFWGNTLS